MQDFDLEIRKRYAQPLAVESGEFPDINMISGRMLPSCYEAGLVNGHTVDAPQFLSVAVETFIKEVLTQVFSRTRSNGPGESVAIRVRVGRSPESLLGLRHRARSGQAQRFVDKVAE